MLFNLAIRLIRHTSIDEISTHGKCLLCNQYGLWLWNAHNIVQLNMRFVWRWVLSLSNKVALRIPISMAMQYVWCGLKAYSHGKLHENGYFQVNAARVSTSLSFYILTNFDFPALWWCVLFYSTQCLRWLSPKKINKNIRCVEQRQVSWTL